MVSFRTVFQSADARILSSCLPRSRLICPDGFLTRLIKQRHDQRIQLGIHRSNPTHMRLDNLS